MKLFIPCRPEDVYTHPHGQGVVVELRREFEAKRPSNLAILTPGTDKEDMLALALDLKDALPGYQFEHGREVDGEIVLIGIYQPERR